MRIRYDRDPAMPSLLRFTIVRIVLFVAAASALAGCMGQKPAQQMPPPPRVTVTKPVAFPVQSYSEYNGYLRATKAVEVKARVKGLLEEVKFIEGEEVPQGTPLYSIDQREYRTAEAKAKADLAKADADIGNWQAQIRLAESELGRATRAMSSGASAQTDFDKAKATLDVNKAQLAVAQASRDSAAAALHTAEIQLGYTDIKAPIAGRISRTHVDPGNLVGQSEPTLLTTIMSVDELYVYFDAPERDLVEYQRALITKSLPSPTSRAIPIEVGVTTELGYPHKGTIDFRENQIDTKTGTVTIRGRVPNPQVPPNNTRLLYPGLYAKVRVPNGEAEQKLVVPEDIIQTGQEGRFVYVIGPKDIVEKRLVTVGPQVWRAPPAGESPQPGWTLTNPKPAPPPDDKAKAGPPMPPAPTSIPLLSVVAIEKGLKPEDRIIVNGLQKVRPNAPATPEDWDFKAPAK